ncbi:MAG: glycosyltransferase family 2 protein [Bacteroidetes bacterium]|nr:MAG: glycosyltransferase family 2 protein [Bacteroidota bacterium]
MSLVNNLPLVSVVTVNYNQSKVTCEFLESLVKITYRKIEIFVVDNDSPTDNPDIIKEKYPYITLLKTKVNLGFAGGNNFALPYCNGKYILFINNDTEVDPNFLEPMVDLLESDSNIGMVNPRVQYFYSPGIIQHAGYTPFNFITIRNFSIGFGKKDKGQFSNVSESGSIFGAAMLVPLKVIEDVGMMADIFFLYYEEHDWAAHIKKAGYTTYYQGKSLVYHKESVSTGKDSPFKIYYLTRGRILFARRNTTGFKKLIAFLYIYFITTPRISIGYMLKLRFDLVWAFWRAVWWNISHSNRAIFELPIYHKS